MSSKMLSIDTVTYENVVVARKGCKCGHISTDGRYYRTGGKQKVCFGCYFNLPHGEYDAQFPELESLPPRPTPEEIRKKQSQASMRWNAKNKDKVREYARKYAYQVYHNKKGSDYYEEHPEEFEALKEKRRDYYHKNKEKIAKGQHEYYQRRKEGGQMTPSQKRVKATLLVEWVANRLRAIFTEFGPEHIVVPKAYEHGDDLRISPELAEILPVSYEMKSQKGYAHVYKDMDQTVKNSHGMTPILVVKSPYKDPLVIMRWEDYEKTLGE